MFRDIRIRTNNLFFVKGFTVMKYTIRTLTFLLCLWLCIAVLAGTVSAQADTPLRLQRTNALSELMADYEAKNPTVGSTIKGILRIYREKVENLPLQADGWTVDAYYYQGVCAGTLAWIYYSHPEVHPLDPQDADSHPIYSLYQEKLAELSSYEPDAYSDDALQAFFLGNGHTSATVECCYTDLLNAIYAYKVRLLHTSGDSEEVHNLIETAALRLEDPLHPTLSFENEDADNYKAYFAYVRKGVEEQRIRDAVSAELIEVYRVLRPDDSFSSIDDLQEHLPYIEKFVRDLPTRATLAEIHSLLADTLRSLLGDVAADREFYTASYLQNPLLIKVTTTISSATVEGHPVELLASCFGERYRLDYARAESKDKLCAEANRLATIPADKQPILSSLLREYTDESTSLFNACTTPDEVHTQFLKGQARLDWFAEYLSATKTIKEVFANKLNDIQTDTLLSRLDAQYSLTDQALLTEDEQASSNGRNAISEILRDAEIAVFYNRHPILPNLPLSPTKEDKPRLFAALQDAVLLPLAALQKTELASDLIALCEAYRGSLIDEIKAILNTCTHTAASHAELNRLIQSTQTELKDNALGLSPQTSTGSWSLSDFLSQAEMLSQKTTALKTLFSHYHDETLSCDPNYYTSQMQSVCEDSARELSAATLLHPQTVSDAIVKLDRLAVLEAIRIAAEEHLDSEGISELIGDAEEALLPDSEEPPSDLLTYRQDMLFRIDNCVLAEALEEQLHQTKNLIDELLFLGDIDRAHYHASVEELREHVDAIRQAEHKEIDQATVSQHRQDLEARLIEIANDAEAKNLQMEKENTQNTFKETTEKLIEQINGYEFMIEAHRDALLDQIATIQTQTEEKILTAIDSDELAKVLSEAGALLDALSREAAVTEVIDCRLSLKSALESYQSSPEEYSAEHMVQIQSIVLKTLTSLDQSESVADLIAVAAAAENELAGIPTRLDEARVEELAQLQERYEHLLGRKDWYSSESLAVLKKLYESFQALIGDSTRYQTASDIDALRAVGEQGIRELCSVRMDRIETEKSSPVQGVITASGAIPFDATLTIGESFSHFSDLQKEIQKAVKEHRIRTASGETPDKTLHRLLQNCVITSVLRFDLNGESFAEDTVYAISFRLSQAIDLSEVLGILYRNENGDLEFYEITQRDSTLSFSSKHVSEFYLVSAKVTNLTPAIILLTLFILFEIAILILLYRRRAHRAAGSHAMAMSFFALSVRTRPSNGMTAVLLLGVAAIGLAAWIAVLLIREYRANKAKPRQALLEERIPIPLLALAEIKTDQDPAPQLPEPPLEILSEITVEIADALMSDECAREQIQSEEEQLDSRIYHGSKRSTINLDTISANFREGDTVTLNDLKTKKLVGENVGFVKILARGRLDKALTILAQDFSTSAIKMIILTGGVAIRTHQSIERQKPKS